MPDKFIDLAEQTGDIVPMGRWILREACRQVRAWQVRLGLPDLQVSVNLSARQFQEHDLVETVRPVARGDGARAIEPDPRDHRKRPDAADDRHDRAPHGAAGARASTSRSTTSGPAIRR